MKFLIFVIDDATGTATSDEMRAIDAFNDSLRQKGHWIFAGGLSGPDKGNVIDNRAGAAKETGASLFPQRENYSGFWLIEAADSTVAHELAMQGSKACNRKVELRPLLG
jgi:hypothetical protein